MRKIKFLNGFISLLLLFHVIFFFGNLYLMAFTGFGKALSHSDHLLIFGSYTRFIQTLFSFILCFGLLFVYFGLRTIISRGHFYNRSGIYFRRGGFFFIVSGILSLIMEIYLLFMTKEVAHIGFMGQDFLLVLMGIGLYILSDFVQKGSTLQQDNDLTI